MSKKAILIPILLIFISAASFAQEEIWIAPITEINRYSVSGVAAGGGAGRYTRTPPDLNWTWE